jgi:predicted SAM-dependent methyltransferase
MKQKSNKLELGCGNRPTPGYLHQDIIALVKLDFKLDPWELPIPENTLSEVLALGVMEHLRFEDFDKTLKQVYRMLAPGGVFLFDVPDIKVWSEYLYKVTHELEAPFSKEHVYSTIWGWQRWQGDEHKCGWTEKDLFEKLFDTGFWVKPGLEAMRQRNIKRNRFDRPEDAHIYIEAEKKTYI